MRCVMKCRWLVVSLFCFSLAGWGSERASSRFARPSSKENCQSNKVGCDKDCQREQEGCHDHSFYNRFCGARRDAIGGDQHGGPRDESHRTRGGGCPQGDVQTFIKRSKQRKKSIRALADALQ